MSDQRRAHGPWDAAIMQAEGVVDFMRMMTQTLGQERERAERAETQASIYRAALRFYDNDSNWHDDHQGNPVLVEGGNGWDEAREALEKGDAESLDALNEPYGFTKG